MNKRASYSKYDNKKSFVHEKLELIYLDQWIAVIYKPTGLLSVPYPGSKARTAQSVLEELLRKQGIVNSKHKPFPVHRLDRDTSGVMMFALSEQAQKKIMNSWHKMVTERLYHALAEISPLAKKNPLMAEGLIDDPISLNAYNIGYVKKNRKKIISDKVELSDKKFNNHEMPARTHYKKLIEGSNYALFELSLDTGKKNQIRAHLSAHGYPIAGDKEHRSYTNPFNRLCLHARTLEFIHPFTGEKMRFEVPEPEQWSEFVKKGMIKTKSKV